MPEKTRIKNGGVYMFCKAVKKLLPLGLVFALLLSFCSCEISDPQINMFANIGECQNIELLKSQDAKVEIYDLPERDRALKDLEYEEFFACKYTSKDFKFEIFAYVFSNEEDAMQYFENETGKTDDPNPTYSISSGMNSYSRIIISGNKAYTVNCKKSKSEQVVAFINSCFSKRIIVTHDGDYPALIEAGNTGDGSIVSKNKTE